MNDVYVCGFADIAGAWLDTLLDVIDLLPKDIIKKDVSLKMQITEDGESVLN